MENSKEKVDCSRREKDSLEAISPLANVYSQDAGEGSSGSNMRSLGPEVSQFIIDTFSESLSGPLAQFRSLMDMMSPSKPGDIMDTRVRLPFPLARSPMTG